MSWNQARLGLDQAELIMRGANVANAIPITKRCYMTEYTYSRKWSFPGCKPRDSFDASVAQGRFDGPGGSADHLIAVAAWDGEGVGVGIPQFVLEVTPGAGFVYAYLLDEWNRICHIYHFEKMGARMFLFNRVAYMYPDEPRHFHQFQATSIESIGFRANGCAKRKVTDKAAGVVDEVESGDVDVSGNWEPVPEFGEWGPLGKCRL